MYSAEMIVRYLIIQIKTSITRKLYQHIGTVGLPYAAVCYNTKSDITQSDLGPQIVESTTRHFYVKRHEIRN